MLEEAYMILDAVRNLKMPTAAQALDGREEPVEISERHVVLNQLIHGPFDINTEIAVFGAGCFWGVEKKFWELDGVISTSVGYCGGYTPNPLYDEVCSGLTGHNEAVRVVFSTERLEFRSLLKVFCEMHDPTQGMRQGNDIGTQYRSGIYYTNEDQRFEAEKSLEFYGRTLKEQGFDNITTELVPLRHFYFAENYHQQYLAKNPSGYCGLGGTGIKFDLKDCRL